MEKELCFDIEVKEIFDRVCVKYFPKSDEFIWRPIAEKRSTEAQRKELEHRFRIQYNQTISKTLTPHRKQ